MMIHRALDPVDLRLLDGFQRDFPIVERPYAEIGAALGLSEDDVIARLAEMQKMGRVTRVGATCAPNTLSASTLAAMRVPATRIEQVARLVTAEPGVNHAYLRENAWNFWFVATGPDRDFVEATLDRLHDAAGLEIIDLPLVRAFNVDLGFNLTGERGPVPPPRRPDLSVIGPGDRALMQQLVRGLALDPDPFGALAERLDRPRAEVIARVEALAAAGIIARLGVIVRHRALGWTSNAMVTWNLPAERIDSLGPALAATPGITLCYERQPIPEIWPDRLFTMIHGRSRKEALDVLEAAIRQHRLEGVAHRVLFSTQCFKQTGALVAHGGDGAEVERRA